MCFNSVHKTYLDTVCAIAHFQKESESEITFIVYGQCVCVLNIASSIHSTHAQCVWSFGWLKFLFIQFFLHHHSTNEQSHVYAYTTTATIKWRLFVLIFSICFLFLFGSAQFGLILFFGNGYYYFIFHLKNYNFTKNFCFHCWQHDQSE